MAQFVNLNPGSLRELHVGNERLVSYNVEMTEVTGGTFWKAYTPAQIAGTEPFVLKGGFLGNATASTDLMQYYDPIDLSDKKLRKLAKEIGPAWVRVSGTWSTKTYYDFDGHTNGVIPEGYNAILTREQWLGVLDFCKDIGAKLLISVADCEGLHHADEPWNPSQAEQIFALSKEYGKAIDAAEFVNEPNLLAMSGCPKGYTTEQYVRDQDIFIRWLHENYPDCSFVGPCSTEGVLKKHGEKAQGGGVGDILPQCSTDDLMKGAQEKLDVYSYHYYNGVSERLEPVMPFAHWKANKAHTEEYLAVASNMAKFHAEKRDIYCPGGEMWVTEAGDAGGGGDTWASTYLDVFRTLNELGSFSVVTRGIIFHNTLASSDYGYLKPEVFDPRPNYFADGHHRLRRRRAYPRGCARLCPLPCGRQAGQGVSGHQQQPDGDHHRHPAEGSGGLPALRRDPALPDYALQRQGAGPGRRRCAAGDHPGSSSGGRTRSACCDLHVYCAVILTL